MKRTKLIKILAVFSASELRRLKDFVASPFFNKNEKIQLLFDFIIRYAPDFNHPKLTEENAFAYVFKNELFKQQAITKLSSKLYKLIYTFIHLEKDKEKGLQADINFLNFLNERELIHEYTQHLNHVKKGIDNLTMRDAEYFYQQFLVEQELAKLKSSRADFGTGDVNFQSAVNALDKYYLVQKLIYLCNQYNRQLTTPQQGYHFELVLELEKYIPDSPYFAIPTIRIWFTTLQLLKSNVKEKHYFDLKELVFNHYEALSTYDIRNVFSTIQNNSRLVFDKKEDYYKELFELYNFQLEIGIFDNPVIFTPQIFLNMITSAILLDKFVWVERLLDNHVSYAVNRDDDIHCLGRAMLAFAKKKYPEAQDFLNQCVLKNIYFKLNERRLRLKVYYELQYYDLLDDSINSFRKFLSKNKESISELHLKANREFVNLSKQIFYLQKSDFSRIKSLKEEIEQARVLPEKRWLLEKIRFYDKK